MGFASWSREAPGARAENLNMRSYIQHFVGDEFKWLIVNYVPAHDRCSFP